MLKGRFVVGLMLVSALTLSGAANGAFYFDIWPATADGSMNQHPTEGYAIGSEGAMRFAKSYHHMPFLGFDGKSDGPDGIPQDRSKSGINDTNDGVLLADWLIGKKAFGAVLYFRSATSGTCDPYAAPGTFLNAPVTVLGFRCANEGEFTDHDLAGSPLGGTFDNPDVGAGKMGYSQDVTSTPPTRRPGTTRFPTWTACTREKR